MEVFLVDPDDLGQLVNRYSIIQHGLHDKPRQFRDCQTVWEYLRDKDHRGKTFLILLDVTLFETEASEWLESLQKTPSLNAISVAVLSPNPAADLDTVARKFPTNLGVFQNPLKKQQIDHLKSLFSLPNQQFGH